MAQADVKGRIKSMLDMHLSVAQVITGIFATVTAVVATMIHVQTNYETKADADRKDRQIAERITKVENGFENNSKLTTEIYGDVKKISGILEAQMAEKMSKKK